VPEVSMTIDKNMKILIVDDFSTMRRIMKNILKQLNFVNIIEADDGSTALETLQREKIDLVVSLARQSKTIWSVKLVTCVLIPTTKALRGFCD
jgi:response regulator RpfG family c-di-GMP phosphodiesterase